MTTPMPPELSALVSETLDAMRKRDDHHILPIERDRIYQSFRDKDGKVDWRLASWLSLKSAQKVLPILRRAAPSIKGPGYEWLPEPDEMLQTAEDVLRGKLDVRDKRFTEVYEIVYNSTNSWGQDETKFPWCAYYAGSAIYATFVAIHICDPFRPVRIKHPCSQLPVKPKTYPRRIQLDDQATDDDLSDHGDASGQACNAYSMPFTPPELDEYETPHDLDKRREFWEWWLTEAIPEVWAIVSADAHASDSTQNPHDSHNSNAKE